MRNELQSAVDFLTDLLAKKVTEKKSEFFRQTLHRELVSHYQNHWFPEKPFKGSAYRCIRINHKMDPIIQKAGTNCGFTESELFALLPNEFTMWVDPREVSYRIGEEGSIGVVYTSEDAAAAELADLAAQQSSTTSSNNQNNNIQMQQEQQHRQQQQQHQQQQQQLHQNQDFFRSCKDQLRSYILPDETTMNLEYLSSFVAS